MKGREEEGRKTSVSTDAAARGIPARRWSRSHEAPMTLDRSLVLEGVSSFTANEAPPTKKSSCSCSIPETVVNFPSP